MPVRRLRRFTIHPDQVRDRPVGLNRMAQGQASMDLVTILSPDLLPFDDPCSFEVNNDSLNGSFRDADVAGEFAE